MHKPASHNEQSRDYAAEEWARDRRSLAVAEIDRSVSVGELIEQACQRAGQFMAQGVIPGSRVIVARPNVIEFVVDYLAVRLCGAVLVNLPWSAGTRITELAEILDARCVVLAEHLVGDQPLFDQLGDRRFRPDEEAAIGPSSPPPRGAEELAWLACTSGTTGTPKAAMHTYASLERQTGVCGISMKERGVRANEGIEIIRKYWSGERFSYDGKIFKFEDMDMLPPPKMRTVQLPEGGSAARHSQEFLGEEVRVVSAFQNIAATHLADLEHEINCDVLVCGNDPAARRTVIALANDANMQAWHAGRNRKAVNVGQSNTSGAEKCPAGIAG